jgi:hypothetical protein
MTVNQEIFILPSLSPVALFEPPGEKSGEDEMLIPIDSSLQSL